MGVFIPFLIIFFQEKNLGKSIIDYFCIKKEIILLIQMRSNKNAKLFKKTSL